MNMNKASACQNKRHRRYDELKKKRLIHLAKNNNFFPGPYLDKHDNPRILYRGAYSKYRKNQSNRKIRRTGACFQRGQFKKAYKYWDKLY